MTALERLKQITSRTSGSTGAALRSLAVAGGLAGALLVSYSGLPASTARQHLLASGQVVAPVAAHLQVAPVARLWVAAQPGRVFEAAARVRPLCVLPPVRAWAWGAVPRNFAVHTPARVFYAQAAARAWVAQDALRLLTATPLGRPWATQPPPRGMARAPAARIFKISQ